MRQCMTCFRSTASGGSSQSKSIESSQSEALNAEEIWNRKKNTKSSKYLKSVPNWGLVPVNKKVAISQLLNENRSRTLYTMNKKKINITNTCAVDAIIHIIAGGYSYHTAYRSAQINLANKEAILQIARMLATG